MRFSAYACPRGAAGRHHRDTAKAVLAEAETMVPAYANMRPVAYQYPPACRLAVVLPRSANGKLPRRELARLFEAQAG